MEIIEIFDKNGKPLELGDVIHAFIMNMATKYNKDIENVYLGVDNSKWNKHKSPSIYMVEVLDNGYDSKDVFSFGDKDVLKINI